MVLLFLILIIFVLRVGFNVPMYAIVLGIIGIVALMIVSSVLESKAQKRTADDIEKARLIDEIAVYKKKSEYTGYSISWHERRDHYTYKNVLDHYECVFIVTHKDGKCERITCKKGSTLYNELIEKSNIID